jgi:hypothetical protein
MIGVFWRHAPWWMAIGAATLALFDVQLGIAGKALMLAVMAIGLVGAVVAPWADALPLAIAVSLFPGDIALLGTMLVLLFRAAASRSLRFGDSLRSMMFVGFFISAAGSALFGLIAVEARPIQCFVWMATLGAPLLLLGGASPRLPDHVAPLVSRFLVFALWLQVPVCVVQLVRHGGPEPGDWFAGSWNNQNLVGLWGATTLSVCAVRLLTGTATLRSPRAWMTQCGHLAAAVFLVWGASAKLYSASAFGAAGVVIVMVLIAGTGISRIGTLLRSSVVIIVILLAGALSESWVRDNFEGFMSNLENSEKRILLTRVALEMGERYNFILGVGPGMLGSRAASVASGDILYKESERPFARWLQPAPKPERWAMYGLWDAEVAEGITNRSAMVSMPFSGWGSIRAELGWPAVILLLSYFVSLSRQMAIIAMRYPAARTIGLAAAVGCVALLPMLFFDNLLEQPQIIGPLCMLVIATRGIAEAAREQAASASVRPPASESSVSQPRPSPSPFRGRL